MYPYIYSVNSLYIFFDVTYYKYSLFYFMVFVIF